MSDGREGCNDTTKGHEGDTDESGGWAPQPIPKKLYIFIYNLICVTLPMTTGPTTQTMIAEVSDGREGRDNTRVTQMRVGDGLHSPSPNIVRLFLEIALYLLTKHFCKGYCGRAGRGAERGAERGTSRGSKVD